MPPEGHTLPSSRRTALARRATHTLAGALCIGAAVSIWALLMGSFGATDARILASTFVISLCTLGGLVGATLLQSSDLRRALGQTTIALSVITGALALAPIWSIAMSDLTGRSLIISTVLMSAGAHACLMLGGPRLHEPYPAGALSRLAVTFATAAALLLSALVTFDTGGGTPDVLRFLGVLVVLAVLTTLLVPISRRLTRDGGAPQQPDQRSTESAPSRPAAAPTTDSRNTTDPRMLQWRPAG